MADGTIVIYNGVRLQDCQTEQFEQEVVYDDSNTDMIFSRFHIRVSCTVHANATLGSRLGVLPEGMSQSDTATAWMKRTQELLSHPRGEFTFQIAGETLLYATPLAGSAYSDCDNGPKPTVIQINAIMGMKAFRITFGIIVTQIKCPNQTQIWWENQPGKPGALADRNVLNNRWTVTEERDGQFLMTRVIEGVLRTAHIVKWPHAYRFLVLPPLEGGFRRENMRFWDSADGLTMHYQITDRQKYAAPPPPAINWYATYTESMVNQGMLQFGEVRVVLEGHPETDKRELLTAALKVVFARLTGLARQTSDPSDAHSCFVRQLAIVEHMHENRLEVTAMVQHNTIDEKFLNLRINKIGEDLSADEKLFKNYDRYRWPLPHPYQTTAPIALFAKYWQDPCWQTHGYPDPITPTISNADQKKKQAAKPDYPENNDIIPSGSGLPKCDGDDTSKAQRGSHPYTHYELDNEYDIDEGIVSLPNSGVSMITRGVITAHPFQIHSGYARRIIQVHAERVGAPPSFGTPVKYFDDANGIRHTLLHWKIYPSQPTLLPDGVTKEFSCQVRYVYALSRPPLLTEQLAVGVDPRINLDLSERVLNLQQSLSLGIP